MSAQNVEPKEIKSARDNGGLVAGIILVGIGAGLLIFQLLGLPQVFPLLLGLIFLATGIATRKVGFLIPGGIIGGVGLGTFLTAQGWLAPLDSTASSGVFLLSFALGWFSITILSKLFTRETHYWPLIPGIIIGLIGALNLGGASGLAVLKAIGDYWPLILVIVGLVIMWQWWRERRKA